MYLSAVLLPLPIPTKILCLRNIVPYQHCGLYITLRMEGCERIKEDKNNVQENIMDSNKNNVNHV